VDPKYETKRPYASITWITPDGREFEAGSIPTEPYTHYDFSTDIPIRRILLQNPQWEDWFEEFGLYPTPDFYLLFADPAAAGPVVLPGTYTMRINAITFEENSDLEAEFVLIGQVYGAAGTDYMRRDLLVPLLWGMPFALVFGLLGACVATFFSLLVAATGAWFGGWVDRLIQWLVEANLVLPIIAISVLIYSYFNTSIWTLLGVIVLLNVFGSPTKSFRSAILQVKEAPYVEAARAYGAGNARIIFQYLIPRIFPIMIPQLVTLIPSYVFLEATLGIFNVYSIYPTWGRVIFEALKHGVNWGSPFWVLEPIALLLLTGLAFTMLGFALERILNPRLITK
jgi:peptide/nickel transport system permease protein